MYTLWKFHMDRNNGGLETATPLKFDSLGHPCQISGTYCRYIHMYEYDPIIQYIQVPKVQFHFSTII